MISKLLSTSITTLFLLVAFANSIAASNELIHIEADHLNFNDQTGLSIYRGNVKLTQGATLIKADRLEVYSKNNVLDYFIAYGRKASANQPATRTLFTDTSETGEKVVAYANTLYYYDKQTRLQLKGEAELTQGNNTIRSQYIEYNTEKKAVIAGGSPTGETQKPRRVKMTITPTNKSDKKKP